MLQEVQVLAKMQSFYEDSCRGKLKVQAYATKAFFFGVSEENPLVGVFAAHIFLETMPPPRS